jgi:GH24 family phage-related lysozyme (muramidase)
MFKMQDAVDYFREHEGVVSHMYLDVVGLVTIGVGFMIPDPGSAAQLNLVHRGNATAATSDEKQQEWQAVHSQTKARPAGYYTQFTVLDMTDAEIDAGLTIRIQNFVVNLRQRFPQFDGFPSQAQLGLLDMIYSLGPRGLFNGYPKFCKAVDKQDWATCAKEGARRNVSPSRNSDLQQLFLDAAAGDGADAASVG